MKRSITIFILICSCFSGFTQGEEDVMLTLGLDSVFSKMKANEAGGSVFVQRGNQLLYSRSFGLANLKTKEVFSESTVSNITPIAKTLIAYSILILQKQGKLSLDDSLLKYFPGFINKAAGAKIKIKHLLSQTSGLSNIARNGNTKLDLIKYTDKVEFEPGSNYKYSNLAQNALTLIIEKVSDVRWQTFIQQNIFQPNGMVNTKITLGSYPEHGEAHAYNKNKEYIYDDLSFTEVPGLDEAWSNLGNLRKYVYAIKECVFLDCETVKLATELKVPDNWRSQKPMEYGFGWQVLSEKNKDTVLECGGKRAGYYSQILLYPQKDIIIICITNNNTSCTAPIIQKLKQRKYIK